MDVYYRYLAIYSFLVTIGSIIYWVLFLRNQPVFTNQSWKKTLVDLISHLPDSTSGPGAHIFAGVFFASGVSGIISIIIADAISSPDQLHGMIISTNSLLIAALFSSVTLWTLWQARRISYQSGYQIHDFHDLISHVNNDLEDLCDSISNVYNMKPQPFHRVYLVTKQPFLGMLTYPVSPETRKFKQHLITLSSYAANSIAAKEGGKAINPLVFEIICGTENVISQFHKEYYQGGSKSKQEIKQLGEDVELEIRQMDEKLQAVGAHGPFYRTVKVPKVQFMIIGNKLYEFTLHPGNSVTEIFNTQVVTDSRYCNAYIETFSILRPDQ